MTPPEPTSELERALAGRPIGGLPGNFRARVLLAVVGELAAQKRSERYALAGLAAAVLLWLNLSVTAVTATYAPLPERPAALDPAATAEQIRHVLPEMPRRDALACAIALRGGAGLVHSGPVPARAAFPRGQSLQGD